ncbi:MAG: hypothetical protein EA398_05055 [Deltaproteobacteria bacterium]|nr:MAG: hypothetical protein EA398_05055 [Deltaproteobacteria bacterium]
MPIVLSALLSGCAEELRDTIPREVTLATAPALPHPILRTDGRRGRVVEARVCLDRLEVEGSAYVIAEVGPAPAQRLAGWLVPTAHAHPGHDHGAESTVAGGFHGRRVLNLAAVEPLAFESAPVRARSVALTLCPAPEAAVTLVVEWDTADDSDAGSDRGAETTGGSGEDNGEEAESSEVPREGDGEEAESSEVPREGGDASRRSGMESGPDGVDSGAGGGSGAEREVIVLEVPKALDVEEIAFEEDWTGAGPFVLELLVDLRLLAEPGAGVHLGSPGAWGARAR